MANKDDVVLNVTKVTWADWCGTTLDGTAVPSDVLKGATFLSLNSEELQTGTLELLGTANASDVLSGKTFYNTNAQALQTGTMQNLNVIDSMIGGMNDSHPNMPLKAGISLQYTRPTTNRRPYIAMSVAASGSQGGYIGPANSWYVGVPATSFGTAAATQVLSESTFTSSAGLKITGTMTNNGAITATINAGESYTIPNGYHNGGGTVTANSVNTYFSVGLWVKRKSASNYYELRVGDSNGSGGTFRFYDWTGESTKALGTLVCNNGNWSKG